LFSVVGGPGAEYGVGTNGGLVGLGAGDGVAAAMGDPTEAVALGVAAELTITPSGFGDCVAGTRAPQPASSKAGATARTSLRISTRLSIGCYPPREYTP
jgi:hypothetical protein